MGDDAPARDDVMLHGRVSKVEATVEGVRSRLAGIEDNQTRAEAKHDRQNQVLLDAMQQIHSRIEKRTTPPVGLWLTAIGLTFTIAGAFVAIIAWFYAQQMEEMNEHLSQIDEIVLYTNSTRFTDADGARLLGMQHAHEAIGGHPPMEARMANAEADLIHRRDEANAKFLRLEDRIDQLAVDIYRHSDKTHVEERR